MSSLVYAADVGPASESLTPGTTEGVDLRTTRAPCASCAAENIPSAAALKRLQENADLFCIGNPTTTQNKKEKGI